MSKRLTSLFTIVMMLVVFSSAHAAQIIAAAPSPYNPVPTTQIIMKDGSVCNPKWWGC